MTNLLPGDVVEFSYNGKTRKVEVEKIDTQNGKTLIGGHDLLLDDFENYRQFDLSKMKNIVNKSVDVEDPKPALEFLNELTGSYELSCMFSFRRKDFLQNKDNHKDFARRTVDKLIDSLQNTEPGEVYEYRKAEY